MIQIIKLKREIAWAEIRLQEQKAVIRSRYARLRGETLTRLSSPKALIASFICGFCVASVGKVRLAAGGVAKSTLSTVAHKSLSAIVFPALYSVIRESISGTGHAVDS